MVKIDVRSFVVYNIYTKPRIDIHALSNAVSDDKEMIMMIETNYPTILLREHNKHPSFVTSINNCLYYYYFALNGRWCARYMRT
jgi:hypothetical protein